jgi:hypothetical protein
MEEVKDIIINLILAFIIGVLVCLSVMSESHAETLKIAIIDTGYDSSLITTGPKLKLCKYGHYDFVKGTSTVGHTIEHGTRVAEILARELASVDYCAIIYSVYNPNTRGVSQMPDEYISMAYNKASYEGVVAINSSFDAPQASIVEREAIRDAIGRGATPFVVAGNRHMNLDNECLWFPACFDIVNMQVVGALKGDLTGRASYSNYGSRVKLWYSGEYNSEERGTSYAVPRAVADYVSRLARVQTTTKTH